MDERILGYMGSPNDRDFYVIHVKERKIADIQLSGVKGINLAVKIWKGGDDPSLIKWIDDNRKSSPERFANLSVTPGYYYFEICQSDRDQRKTDKENPYELILKSRVAISEESEPNDSKEDADTIHMDKEITGYFSPAYNRLNEDKENLHREEDWFALDVNLKSDTPRLINVSLSGVSDVNSLLYLYNPDGDLISMADNGGPGEPEYISGAGIKKSGTYYAMVAVRGYAFNHDEPYTLSATIKEHESGNEMEPNNDFESANSFTNTISGKINSKDDTDVFLYQVGNGPGTFRIELRCPDDMDGILALYNMDREKIMDVNSGGKTRREVHPNFYSEKDFYITVSARSAGRIPSGEYILTVTSLANSEKQEREPNNELSQANKLTLKTISGFTSFRGDKDYFLLVYDTRVKQKFEIQGARGGSIKVSVTDPLGFIIKSMDVQGDRKVVFSEMIDKKGYVIVEAVTENYDNPYVINLRGAQ
ncbi:MAG: hypothetical protein KA369_07485 [Spirochaetes bacterium]|nr:hypothetical protein [Spirochaetota bacterium]